MSVIDEIVVTDNGDVEVRIVPPDCVSTEPDILATYAKGTQVHALICDVSLRKMARALGIRTEVSRAVHGGEDRYTIVTSDGDYVSVDGDSYRNVLDEMKRICGFVEMLELSPRNVPVRVARRSFRPYTTPTIWPPTAVSGHGEAVVRARQAFPLPKKHAFLPGELNPMRRARRARPPSHEAPNKLRRAS